MKSNVRKVVLFALCALLYAPCAFAEVQKAWTFTLYTPGSGVSNYESGNTTASKQTTSGVSTMARRYGEATAELKTDPCTVDISQTSGRFVGRILDLDPSQAATGTSDYSSGTTCVVWVKVVEKNEPSHWSHADFIPVFFNQAINGTSTVPSFFEANGNYMRTYFQPSGITPFGLAKIEISSVEEVRYFETTMIVLKSGYFDQPAGGTGVSSFAAQVYAILDGVKYGEFSVFGCSVYTTADGLTTPAMSGIGQHCAADAIFSLTGKEIRDLKLAPAVTARRISYRLLNRDPGVLR